MPNEKKSKRNYSKIIISQNIFQKTTDPKAIKITNTMKGITSFKDGVVFPKNNKTGNCSPGGNKYHDDPKK